MEKSDSPQSKLEKTQDADEIRVISGCNHGLEDGEPLVFERIIQDCFNNPDRKKYPDFLQK